MRIAASIVICGLAASSPSFAAGPGASWPEVKCARYRQNATEAFLRRGTAGISAGFRARHEAFLASGCTGPADVCPRSAAEIDLANLLTVAAMNAGTASTFLPFGCPGPGASPSG